MIFILGTISIQRLQSDWSDQLSSTYPMSVCVHGGNITPIITDT